MTFVIHILCTESIDLELETMIRDIKRLPIILNNFSTNPVTLLENIFENVFSRTIEFKHNQIIPTSQGFVEMNQPHGDQL